MFLSFVWTSDISGMGFNLVSNCQCIGLILKSFLGKQPHDPVLCRPKFRVKSTFDCCWAVVGTVFRQSSQAVLRHSSGGCLANVKGISCSYQEYDLIDLIGKKK